MNNTAKNKLYHVTAYLQTTGIGDTQFEAVENALFDATDNYTPYIDLISVDIKNTLNNTAIVCIETSFYVVATNDKEVPKITKDTIEALSLRKNGTFNITSQGFKQVTDINDVDSEWQNSNPFSVEDWPMMTCTQILNQ